MTEIAEVKTIGEVERIVHASGLWNGTTAVEFSDDGDTWREAWSPTVEVADITDEIGRMRVVRDHPEFARVTVHRKDVAVPTTVTIRWDEQRPRENDEWAEKWDGAPTRHFGRTARMVAFRQTFRDILGDIQLPDEDRGAAPTPDAPAARDWAAEIDAATTVEEIDALDTEARKARIFTPDAAGTALHRQIRAKRKALAEDAWSPKDLAAAAGVSEDEATEALERVAAAPVPGPARPGPRDHLPPANRAARRSASRKKGRRR